MKNRILPLLLAVLCMLLLCGCQCDHDWEKATCEEPRTCSECGETRGDPKGHDWVDATCEEPKTCSECGETEGEPLGHDWQDATCEEPRTCTECGETEGEPLGHDWQEATYDAPKTCAACGETEGEPLEKPTSAVGTGMSYEEFADVMNNAISSHGYTMEFADFDDSGDPVYSVNSAETGEYLDIVVSFYLDADKESVTGVLVATEEIADSEKVYGTGFVGGVSWALCDPELESTAVSDMTSGTPIEGDDGTLTYYMEQDGWGFYMIVSETMIIFLVQAE